MVKKAAAILANYFGSMDALMKADVDTLVSINDIGPITAQSIVEFFKDESNQKLIQTLKEQGLNMIQEKQEIKASRFTNKRLF